MRAVDRSRLLQMACGTLALFGSAALTRVGPWEAPAKFWSALTAPGDPDLEENVGQPRCVASDLIDVEASDELEELLEAVAALPDPPTLESVRCLMEERGWTEFRYILRVHYTMDFGSSDDLRYMRNPYARPFTAPEFLKFVTAARVEDGEVHFVVEGRRLDEAQAAEYLDLQRHAPTMHR